MLQNYFLVLIGILNRLQNTLMTVRYGWIIQDFLQYREMNMKLKKKTLPFNFYDLLYNQHGAHNIPIICWKQEDFLIMLQMLETVRAVNSFPLACNAISKRWIFYLIHVSEWWLFSYYGHEYLLKLRVKQIYHFYTLYTMCPGKSWPRRIARPPMNFVF